MPPSQIEPTYHTAIWLEDEQGKLAYTLYVSHDLSSTEYKMGEACPDWINQAHWETAPKSIVDAVTGPTPQVGSGFLSFDMQKLGVAPGTYVFKFQMHISDKYNVLHKGVVVIGGAESAITLDVLYSPSKPAGGTEFARDVQARYVPAK